jgi:uncharacterized HAD superfamily protein
MRIGVDIDGVIFYFIKSFLPVVREEYGLELEENDFFTHDLFQVLGVPKEKASELIRKAILRDPVLIPKARESLSYLSQNHEIIILTARYPDLFEITKRQLAEKGIPYDQIFCLSEGNKHQSNLDLDVVIEDNFEDAIGWIGKAGLVIVFDHPWNRSLNVEGLFKRVKSWEDIVRVIDEME